jgi:diadenosine tetraphosphatase ApaH/serine/threonine PP2A family protein phosphatase
MSGRACIAVFGGVYNNHLALQALHTDAMRRGAEAIYFLGDTGGFGPHPDRSVELLRAMPILSMAGNYDISVGSGLTDCGCGYTDPRDNRFAQLSYEYTFVNTSAENRAWLAKLPGSLRVEFSGRRLLMVHGSPRKVNEFLWSSTTPEGYIRRLCEEQQADLICCTHTGVPWERRLPDGRGIVNVGAIGRPANDGRLNVWYALLHADPASPGGVRTEFVPLAYDHARLAREMEAEGLPPEFIETVHTGWWTTCLEIMPPKERRAGRW